MTDGAGSIGRGATPMVEVVSLPPPSLSFSPSRHTMSTRYEDGLGGSITILEHGSGRPPPPSPSPSPSASPSSPSFPPPPLSSLVTNAPHALSHGHADGYGPPGARVSSRRRPRTSPPSAARPRSPRSSFLVFARGPRRRRRPRRRVVLNAGETFHLPAGVYHLPACAGDGEVEFEAVLTPGLASGDMFTELYAVMQASTAAWRRFAPVPPPLFLPPPRPLLLFPPPPPLSPPSSGVDGVPSRSFHASLTIEFVKVSALGPRGPRPRSFASRSSARCAARSRPW